MEITEIEYAMTLISYIDILGMKDIQLNNDANTVMCILNRLKKISEYSKEHRSVFGDLTQYFAFSDTVVRLVNLDKYSQRKDQYGCCFDEMYFLMYASTELIYHHGVFPRGALDIGKLYADSVSNCLFGPGLVCTHGIAEEKDSPPRIIVSDRVYTIISEHPDYIKASHNTAEWERDFLKNFIQKDPVDGKYFIDYLFAFRDEVDEPYDYIEFLRVHKVAIVNNKKKAKVAGVINKYIWLEGYHNNRIKYFIKGWEKRKDNFVDSDGNTKAEWLDLYTDLLITDKDYMS